MRRGVYAGSFDPITFGHLWMVEQGSLLFDELVVAIGVNPDKRHLFSLQERLDVLRSVTSKFPNVRVGTFKNLFLVRYARQVQANFILRGVRNEQDYGYERGMRYVNAEFDEQIQTVLLIPPRHLVEVSSSFVKGLVGPEGWPDILPKYVPGPVCQLFHEKFPSAQGPVSDHSEQIAAADHPKCDRGGLDGRWRNLWRRLGTEPGRVPDVNPLLLAYESPGRHYHNLHHIVQCLQELDSARGLATAPDAMELAIWFHDAVYDPERHDNEVRSADLAAQALADAGVPAATTARVVGLIKATTHRATPLDDDERLLVDIDLSILGRPWEEFDAYEKAIRAEYAHVPDDAFRHGRTAVLRRFLARPNLFSTAAFRSRFEAPARQNLGRAISRLERIIPVGQG
ncbi:MAG TPA: pantetheine-phosphate adenylyltransferase [Tepidisphaeraceae bacterium]|jgi:pantetheine-phosphate adenylyltransferase|nr:pantetheine-phosphate adenylyltransferase [Tepidisphaeraceae bacterium]